MFRAAEMGLPTDLRKLINRKNCTAQDKCGRTVLHRAILRKTKQVIKFLAENYTSIIDIQDNVSFEERRYFLAVKIQSYSIQDPIKTKTRETNGTYTPFTFKYSCQVAVPLCMLTINS